MENWYTILRRLQDESENKYLTRKFCEQVFHELYNAKIKEKQKFKNRMGPEFEQWAASFLEEYPKDLVTEILQDDDFWILTLSLAQGV